MAYRILAVGEVLWDVFPGEKKLGGAPANFACISRRLGADAHLISRVGNDADGREILRRLAEVGLPTEGIGVDPELPTGVVTVKLANGQPTYTIEPNAAWDRIVADSTALSLAESCDAICFGTLAQRSIGTREAIATILRTAAKRPEVLRVLDVNLRKPFVDPEIIRQSVSLANVLKLNQDELPVLSEIFSLLSTEPKGQLAELAARFRLKLVVLTRGDMGSLLYADGEVDSHPGQQVTIVDAVGAGDAFTAATILGWLGGKRVEEINAAATEVAAYVCTQAGATPVLPESLIAQFRERRNPS